MTAWEALQTINHAAWDKYFKTRKGPIKLSYFYYLRKFWQKILKNVLDLFLEGFENFFIFTNNVKYGQSQML